MQIYPTGAGCDKEEKNDGNKLYAVAT